MSDDSREYEHEEVKQETHELEDIAREEADDLDDEKEVNNPIGIQDEEGDDEEDEEEEDEDEDEEDEDDRVRSRKRARRDRNQFLDVEAEVSDDDEDEDEDEDELAKEGFIAEDHAEEEIATRDDRLHRQVDRSHEKSTEEDAQKLAAEFKERYGRANKYRGDDSGVVSQRFLLPSINDPSIWAIRCRPGREKECVRKLLKRKLTLEGKPQALKILSAFQRDNFTGYIYIEAEKLTAVDVAIKGFPDIYPNNKVLVPVEEFPDLLRANKSSDVKIVPGSYVRIKRGKYKGDLAIVDAVEENGLEVTLQVVPRLDYKGQDIDEDTGKRKRVTSKFRPPQRLFSKKDALEFDATNLTVRSSNSFYYRGDEYIDGYLYKLFKLQFLETQSVQPTLEELSRFNTGDTDALDLSSIAQTLSSSRAVIFNTGDRVKVLSGEQQGLQGDVISSSNDTVLIKPRDFAGSNLEFPINNLRKIFYPGDHVSVIKGKHDGHTGIVVSVKEDHVTLISDQSKKDITLFANHLTKSTETSTLIDGQYGLHDLVRINSTTVGVVIKADKDVFTVLSQDGKVLSLSPSAIISKVDLRKDNVFASDSAGAPIKIGDTVRENKGFKRQGSILHIYRTYLFIHSKEITENTGIFVSDITSVTNVASQSNLDEKNDKKVDLTKMNPKFRTGGVMAPPSIPIKQTGRDRTINQHVSVRLGEYKGLRGIIKDANGDIARVELHTKNKIISIAKHKLAFINNQGHLIPYEEFIAQRSDFSSGPSFTTNGSAPASVGGASSHWSGSSNGSKTPAWSSVPRGGRTGYGGGASTSWGGATGYAGQGTSWGGATNHGSSNSSWGNSGGAGTAWGGNGAGTAWGGQAGGANSQWAASTHDNQGQASTYGGAGSQWGGAGGASTYGGGSQWGSRSSYGRQPQQQGWAATPGSYQTAPTPGSYQSAPTPGASYSAPTPYEDTSSSYPSARTPGVPQTPGDF